MVSPEKAPKKNAFLIFLLEESRSNGIRVYYKGRLNTLSSDYKHAKLNIVTMFNLAWKQIKEYCVQNKKIVRGIKRPIKVTG